MVPCTLQRTGPDFGKRTRAVKGVKEVERAVSDSQNRTECQIKVGEGRTEGQDSRFVQMREYSRVDATLPFEVRLVLDEERQDLHSRTSMESALTESQQLPEVGENALGECLKIINRKLDTILNLLTLQTRECCTLQSTPVNISAGGVRVLLQVAYAVGDVLEVKMMLPTLPYVVFYLYGDVVRIETTEEDMHLTCIEFTSIDEEVRDKIAKFVFEKQREALRMKRRQ